MTRPPKKVARTGLRTLLKGGVMVITVLGFTWLSVYSLKVSGHQRPEPQKPVSFEDLLDRSLREARQHDRGQRNMTQQARAEALGQLFDAKPE